MKNCPYLCGIYLLRCTTGDKLYVPTSFQIEEYCKNKKYKMCPIYSESDEYYYLQTVYAQRRKSTALSHFPGDHKLKAGLDLQGNPENTGLAG